jgi:histidinol-phosphatase
VTRVAVDGRYGRRSLGAAAASRRPDVRLAHRMAGTADRIALSRYGSPVDQHAKADGSPVSSVDLAVEATLRAMLAAARPDDGVLGEEAGERRGSSGRRWILDPVDGTRSYLAGGRAWGTNIALEVAGVVTVAVFTRPTEHRTWWAVRGGGAYVHAGGAAPAGQPLAVSRTGSLARARVGGLVDPGSPAAAALARHARWVDDEVSVIAALLEGRLDAVVDDGGDLWDQAPAALLVCEAGGFFQDRYGGARVDLGWGLYGGPHLRDELAAVLGVRAPGRI